MKKTIIRELVIVYFNVILVSLAKDILIFYEMYLNFCFKTKVYQHCMNDLLWYSNIVNLSKKDMN